MNAATLLRGRRPQRHRTRHTATRNSAAWSAGAPLHSSRKRSLEGRRESLYYAPRAREGSIKTQRVMSYQKRVRVTKPCFSNCTIRGTGPSARPRRNAAANNVRSHVNVPGNELADWLAEQGRVCGVRRARERTGSANRWLRTWLAENMNVNTAGDPTGDG